MSIQLHTQTKAVQHSAFIPIQTGLLQRKCACGQHTVAGGECEECRQKREGMLQRIAISPGTVSTVPPIVHEVLGSSGQPLDAGTRAFMEPRFEYDFSQVRVHTDARAAESTSAVNALAYTVGGDVVFGAGQYAPGTREGKRLLAHELTHVVQQGNGAGRIIQRQDPGKSGTASKGTSSATESASPTADADPCGGGSKASSYKPTDKDSTGKEIKVTLDHSFGDTSKLGAFFHFGACIVKGNWRFYLDSLTVSIASNIQPIDFRINVNAASDPVVTRDTYKDIIDDLRPNRKVKLPVVCGGNRFTDQVITYSKRDKYWNQQFVADHEAFHRSDWNKMYGPELIQAEKEVWGHTIPASAATTAPDAIKREGRTLDNYMISAYQRTCKAYAPKQESRAYDAGASKYQKLADDIRDRARKEKWESGE